MERGTKRGDLQIFRALFRNIRSMYSFILAYRANFLMEFWFPNMFTLLFAIVYREVSFCCRCCCLFVLSTNAYQLIIIYASLSFGLFLIPLFYSPHYHFPLFFLLSYLSSLPSSHSYFIPSKESILIFLQSSLTAPKRLHFLCYFAFRLTCFFHFTGRQENDFFFSKTKNPKNTTETLNTELQSIFFREYSILMLHICEKTNTFILDFLTMTYGKSSSQAITVWYNCYRS